MKATIIGYPFLDSEMSNIAQFALNIFSGRAAWSIGNLDGSGKKKLYTQLLKSQPWNGVA